MAGILQVNTITDSNSLVSIPVSQLQRRLVQRTTRWFKGGVWNPGNTYYEIPGSYITVTPMYDNSTLVYSAMIPVCWKGSAAHSISHWVFMANGKEYARFSKSCDHIETGHVHKWEIPSWGKGRAGGLGYISRQYADGSHCIHYNARRYWNGGESIAGVPSWVSVEEYLSIA